jgi:hypothetical protein
MYDTVAVLIDQPPRSVLDSPGWQHERVMTNLQSGERTTARILNDPGGPSLTLLPDGRLKIERSLPKALTGQNVEDLKQSDVGDAIEKVDAEIARALGTLATPSIALAKPVRVDYCESERLGSEDAVRRELMRLRGVELPRKGQPVRGDSGSVSWPKGAIRPKVYGKYVESRGLEAAYGVLRHEVGAFRLKTFRALLGRPATAPVALGDVLTTDVRASVMGRYGVQLAGGLAMAHELTNSRFLAEMLKMFGVRRTASLLGYALLWHGSGEPPVREMDPTRSPFGSQATHYRVVADFRQLRLRLVESGYEVVDEEPDALMREVVHVANPVAA